MPARRDKRRFAAVEGGYEDDTSRGIRGGGEGRRAGGKTGRKEGRKRESGRARRVHYQFRYDPRIRNTTERRVCTVTYITSPSSSSSSSSSRHSRFSFSVSLFIFSLPFPCISVFLNPPLPPFLFLFSFTQK